MRLAGHVPRKGEMRNACKTVVGNPEYSQDLGVDERIKFKWTKRKNCVSWIHVA
jgi:hypothetical protein